MGLADYGLSVGGDLYVSDYFSDTVTVISAATNVVVASVVVGTNPYGIVYDTGNGNVYVVNQDSDSVSVINGTSNTVVASVPVGNFPRTEAYDAANGNIYVVNVDDNNVSVISGLTNKVVTNIPVGVQPEAIAYDTANGEVYVANACGYNYAICDVSIISTVTNTVVATTVVGAQPSSATYDPANGNVYVANSFSNNVSVIDGTTNSVIASVPVGSMPEGTTYDAANGNVYVANSESNNVSVISGATNKVVANIPVGTGPTGAGYDSANGDIYVGNEASSNMSVITGATNHVTATIPGLFFPVYVAYVGPAGAGTPTPSILNSTALRGYVDADSTGIWGEDLYQSSPDGFSIQMNAVLTNVTLVGQPGFSFWTQDVVTYFPSTGYMFLVSNVWNFSAPNDTVTNGTIYSHGPFGTSEYGTLGYYYASYAVPHAESYPFNVTLTMGSSVSSGRNNVSFSVSVWSPTNYHDDFNMTDFDYVVFNSLSPILPVPVSTPSNYTASGLGYNKVGLADDFELVITGPGGGSQVDLSAADAILGLAYYSSYQNGTFLAIPSAYNYGSDTGETSSGAYVAWSNATSGNPGVWPYATMSTGPSILTGLWGNGAPEGTSEFSLSVVFPPNAFVFMQYLGTASFTEPIVSQFEYVPTFGSGWVLLYLMAGSYNVMAELADYTVANYNITVPSMISLNVSLASDPSLGVYTPLWASSNAQIQWIAQSGTGAPSSPYVLFNNQYAPLSSTFGLYNDYSFPVFPGVFLKDTDVSVELNNSSTFETYTNSFQPYPYESLPTTNDLQFWFWNVSGVAIHNATNISGWFGRQGYFPLTFNSFNVVFYESSDNLVANNDFYTESQGLLMYSSGTQFGSQNIGGGNNTVWGNRFIQIDPPLGCPGPSNCSALLPYNSGLALEIGENSDLIYNNLFDTPTTAWLLPLNLYSGFPEKFVNTTWNISSQPASTVHTASGFPTIPLSGSIVFGATQGGNSWWDYGVTLNWANGADNPTEVLPYDENASNLIHPSSGYGTPLPGYNCIKYYCSTYIYSGGDDAPLETAASAVSVGPHGLLSETVWGSVISCAPVKGTPGGGPPGGVCCGPVKGTPGGGMSGCGGDPRPLILAQFQTRAPSVNLVLPVGEFNWTPIVPPKDTSSVGGSFVVAPVTPVTVTVPYATPGNAVLTFSETGLPSGLLWQVTVAGSSMSLTSDGGVDSLNFIEPVSSTPYPYTISANPGWYESTLPYSGNVLVSTAPTTEPTLVYSQVTYPVTFSESGLPSGLPWEVTFDSVPMSLTTNGGTDTLAFGSVPNGTYSYAITGNGGYHESTIPYTGTEVVNGVALAVGVTYVQVTYGVAISESGLPSGLTWKVTFNSVSMSLTTNGGTDSLAFASEPNGTYTYSITGNPGYHESTIPYTGTESVIGTTLTVSLTYTQVTYGVTFSESGLPSGLTWTVTFNSAAMSLTTNGGTDTLTFASEPNGTYSYSITGNAGYHESTIPYTGSETIQGASLAVRVTYVKVTYSVTFWELGLPAGLTWKVTVNGLTKSLTTNGLLDSLNWTGLGNGTYTYSVTDNPGWHEATLPYNGKITINGASVNEVLVYFLVTYSVTFSESGLPAGLTWSVTVGGVTQHIKTDGKTDSLTWYGLPNGTYAYAIAAIPGWHQSTLPPTGSVVVKGASVSEPTLRYSQ